MHKELKDSLEFIFKKEKLHECQLTLNINRKTLKTKRWAPIFISFSVIVIACLVFLPLVMDNSLNVSEGSYQPETQTKKSEIFNYKGAYIGDHLSVAKIISYSLNDQTTNGIQLYTSDEPFGVRTFIAETMAPTKDYEVIFKTASYLFTLIRNIDFVEFEYEDKIFSLAKEDLEKAFNVNYYSFEDEEVLRSIISDLLSNEQSKDIIYQLIKVTAKE